MQICSQVFFSNDSKPAMSRRPILRVAGPDLGCLTGEGIDEIKRVDFNLEVLKDDSLQKSTL
jgi:hypothetical protein